MIALKLNFPSEYTISLNHGERVNSDLRQRANGNKLQGDWDLTYQVMVMPP